MPAITRQIDPFSDAYDPNKQRDYLGQVIKGEKRYKPEELKSISSERREVLLQALNEIKTTNNAQAIVKYRLIQELKTAVDAPADFKTNVSVKVTKKTDTLYKSTFTVSRTQQSMIDHPSPDELVAAAKENDLERVKYICSSYAQIIPKQRAQLLSPAVMHDLAKSSPLSFECALAVYPPEDLESLFSIKIDGKTVIEKLFDLKYSKHHLRWMEKPHEMKNQLLQVKMAMHAVVHDQIYFYKIAPALNYEDPNLMKNLVKFAAERKGHYLAIELIQYFGIKNQNDLIEIAKSATAYKGDYGIGISSFIQKYGINKSNQEGLIEIAKLAAAQLGGETSAYIQHYGIDSKNQKALIEIAKIAAAQNGSQTSVHIQNYGITDQKALIEIAMIAAAKGDYSVSFRIQNFGISSENQKDLIDIANVALQRDAFEFSNAIQNYGFTEDNFFELAKLLAQNSGIGVSIHIQDYGIADQDKLIELAKLAAQEDGGSVCQHFKNYGIDIHNQKARIELARLAAQNNGCATSHGIDNFGITDQATVFEIVLEAAESVESEKVKIFNIDYLNHPPAHVNPDDFRKILNRLLRRNAADAISLVSRSKTLLENPDLLSKSEPQLLKAYNGGNVNEIAQALSLLNEDYPGLEEALKKVDKIENPENKLNALTCLSFFVLQAKSLKDQQLVKQNLMGMNFLPQIIELRDSQLRIPLVNYLIDTLSSQERYLRVVTGHTPKNLLLRMQLGALDLTKAEIDVHIQNLKPVLTDQVAINTVISTLVEITCVTDISKKAIHESIRHLFSPPVDKIKVLKECRLLKGILLLKGGVKHLNDAAEHKKIDLFAILGDALKENAPFITEIPGFSEKFAATFLQSRNPTAIMIYIACLSTLSESIKSGVDRSLNTFITAVFDGNFEAVRCDTAHNLHLAALTKDHSKVLGKFQEGAKVTRTMSEAKAETVVPTHLKIKTALRDGIATHKHLTDAGLSDKIQIDEKGRGLHYLQNLEQPDLAELQIKLEDLTKKRMEAAKDKTETGKKQLAVLSSQITYLKLQQNILTLMKPDLKRDEVKKLLGDIATCLKADCAFRGDLALIESMFNQTIETATTVTLIDTSDPYEILLAGTEVLGSCQRIDGDPNLNRGLLGYMLNGQDRMIVLKEGDATSDTPIKGRAIFRLLIDEDNKPVLLLEPIYPKTLEAKYKDKIIAMATQRAKALGVPLVRSIELDGDGEGEEVEVIDEKQRFGKNVRSLGGRASEYVDSAGGIQDGAVYTINNPSVIFQPAVVTA